MTYTASPERYEGKMQYRRTGRSGLDLPVLSLGYWHTSATSAPSRFSARSRGAPSTSASPTTT
jgi:hypothetical protein